MPNFTLLRSLKSQHAKKRCHKVVLFGEKDIPILMLAKKYKAIKYYSTIYILYKVENMVAWKRRWSSIKITKVHAMVITKDMWEMLTLSHESSKKIRRNKLTLLRT